MKIIDRPPSNLGASGRDLWNTVIREYPLNGSSRRVLLQAGQALDRLRQIRDELKKDGLTFVDKFNQIKPHPLLIAEGAAIQQFVRCMRLLNLDFADFEIIKDEKQESAS